MIYLQLKLKYLQIFTNYNNNIFINIIYKYIFTSIYHYLPNVCLSLSTLNVKIVNLKSKVNCLF